MEEQKILTPIKAIRAKCLECCCGQVSEVRECELNGCSLHPYRMGHNPNRKRSGVGNAEALKRWRENQRVESAKSE